MWHEAMANSRATLVIENMIPTRNADALFAMMLAEGVPLPSSHKPCSGCSIILTPVGPCRGAPMAGPLIGGGRPINRRLPGFVAVLAQLKAIVGRGEISTDVPFLLFGLILFAT